MEPGKTSITILLANVGEGRPGAAEDLIAVVYPELRRLAAHQFRGEMPGHTLQPTAVVHELYVRLFAGQEVNWQNRAHFFAVAAQQIRRILIDYARARRADKRGGGQVRVTLSNVLGGWERTGDDVLALHEVLTHLEQVDSRAARVVELRFFGGLEEEEAAEVLGISRTTLKRDWVFARAWLLDKLTTSETS